MSQIAVVGAGWAGCAAALKAARSGHQVTVFEASRVPGGRARKVPIGQHSLDNGQHILIGAYTDTLALLKSLGVEEKDAFLRIPLQLRKPDGSGLSASAKLAKHPRLAVAGAVLGASGWTWLDKLSLTRTAVRWEYQHFDCDSAATVAQVCQGMRLAVMRDLIEPLCVSALNTPADRASGKVFLRVMHDALFAQSGGSDYLLPRWNLSALLPERALQAVQALGGVLRLGERVTAIEPLAGGGYALKTDAQAASDEQAFDAVMLAAPPWEAARLCQTIAPAWAAQCEALRFEAIATVYAQTTPAQRLSSPVLALACSATAPAQFAFDRGQFIQDGSESAQGLWGLVVSASQGSATEIEAAVLQQARSQLLAPGTQIEAVQTIVEKRATFACEPGTQRPSPKVAAHLVAVGDYVDGPYPATLEGAIRSVRHTWPHLGLV